MRRAAGFTLIEVICVLAIIALLASLVLPAIPRATSRARLEAYALEVASLLTADRTAAIRRRAEVTTALDASARERVPDASGFADLSAARQVELLHSIEHTPFFGQLHTVTVVGLLASPAYGGNREGAGWKLIGFPGAIAVHRDHVEQYRDKKFPNDPVGIADMS